MQVSNAVTRSVEGTGLGLVMVPRLAQLHGGTVAVTSEPDKGSCFTVWLPLHEGVRPDSSAAETRVATHAERRLALIVEDNDDAAALMRAQLEAEGFEGRRAASAQAAPALGDGVTPDVHHPGNLLPGMGGGGFPGRPKGAPGWGGGPVGGGSG